MENTSVSGRSLAGRLDATERRSRFLGKTDATNTRRGYMVDWSLRNRLMMGQLVVEGVSRGKTHVGIEFGVRFLNNVWIWIVFANLPFTDAG
jgi:hypothetical protein